MTRDDIASVNTALTNASAPGSMPVQVMLTTGSMVEVAEVKISRGDLLLWPTVIQEGDVIVFKL